MWTYRHSLMLLWTLNFNIMWTLSSKGLVHAQHVTPPCATCYASQNVIIRSRFVRQDEDSHVRQDEDSHFESLQLVHSDQRNGDGQQSNMEA